MRVRSASSAHIDKMTSDSMSHDRNPHEQQSKTAGFLLMWQFRPEVETWQRVVDPRFGL